jgi:Fic family protein
MEYLAIDHQRRKGQQQQRRQTRSSSSAQEMLLLAANKEEEMAEFIWKHLEKTHFIEVISTFIAHYPFKIRQFNIRGYWI